MKLTPIWLRPADGRVPVLLLPGFCGDLREMAPLVQGIERPVVGFDLCSPSAAFPAAVEQALAACGVERFHLVAGSFGGLLGGGLAGLASFAPIGMVPDARFIRGPARAWARLSRWVPDGPLVRLYARRLARSLADDGVAPDLAAAVVARWTALASVTGADQKIAAAAVRDRLHVIRAWAVSPRRSVPTLWIEGVDDPFVHWSDAEVRAACPTASVVRVPGRHRPHASHAEALANVLNAFWARVHE